MHVVRQDNNTVTVYHTTDLAEFDGTPFYALIYSCTLAVLFVSSVVKAIVFVMVRDYAQNKHKRSYEGLSPRRHSPAQSHVQQGNARRLVFLRQNTQRAHFEQILKRY